jgi:hypothetical protein
MNKPTTSFLPGLFLGAFWIILTINTTFNWSSTGTLFFWLFFTIIAGWFAIRNQNRVRRI